MASLSLDNNALEGPLPDLSRLSALSSLRLQFNHLNSSIPTYLATMGLFDTIALNDNNLSGRVPAGLLSRVTGSVFLHNNSLSGCLNASDATLVCHAGGNPRLCACEAATCDLFPCNVEGLPADVPSEAPPTISTPPVTPTVQIFINSSTIFRGNFVLNDTTALSVVTNASASLRDPILRISGCASLGGTLMVTPSIQAVGMQLTVIWLDGGHCGGVMRTFHTVKTSYDGNLCGMQVSVTAIYDPRSVRIFFGQYENHCAASPL